MARWSARADWRLWLALLASLLAHLLWLTPDWAWLPAPARDEPPAAGGEKGADALRQGVQSRVHQAARRTQAARTKSA